MGNSIIGYYGKLPTHGDFVKHNLPRSFTESWDQWLQENLLQWRKTFQKDWVAHYLTMPVHCFVLSPGIAGETAWCGILLPSRDQAGRLFPFTVSLPVPASIATPIQIYESSKEWLGKLEQLAIGCLMPDFSKEQLHGKFLDELNALASQCPQANMPANAFTSTEEDHTPQQTQFAWHCNPDNGTPLWQNLLHNLSRECLHAYSIWWTSDQNDLMLCQGLPGTDKTPAFIDQQWRQWGWITASNNNALPAPKPTITDDDDTQTL